MKTIYTLLISLMLVCGVGASDIGVRWTDTLVISDTASAESTVTISRAYPILDLPETPIKYIYPSIQIGVVDSMQVNRGLFIDAVIEISTDYKTWTVWDSITVDKGINDTIYNFPARIALTDTTTAFTASNFANHIRLRTVKFCSYVAADTLNVGKKYTFDARLWLTGRY